MPATPDPAMLLAECRRELSRLPAMLEAMLIDLDDVLWRVRPAPTEWSPVEIVCSGGAGFEVYGLPATRWCPDIEDRIAGAVAQLAREVRRDATPLRSDTR